MGSISEYVGHGLRMSDVRERIHGMMESTADNVELIDKSGIIGWSRCWGLYEERTDDGAHVLNRFIAVMRFDYSHGRLTHKFEDESEGPRAYDCPLRLLSAADEFPIDNEIASEWRREAFAAHAQAGAARTLIREISKDWLHGDARIVVKGRATTYLKGRQGGRSRHAYWGADGEAYGLNPVDVDVPASRLLRVEPRT